MKVYNKHIDKDIPKDAVYVGRPTKWGNPFLVKTLGRKEAVEAYREYLARSGMIAEVHELKGKDLVCWCAPEACHADILLSLANPENTTQVG